VESCTEFAAADEVPILTGCIKGVEGVPSVIVKGKAAPGETVGLATTSCFAIGEVKVQDRRKLAQIPDSVSSHYTALDQVQAAKHNFFSRRRRSMFL
jgi:hypothetical protein